MEAIMKIPGPVGDVDSGKVWDPLPLSSPEASVPRRFTFGTDRTSIFDFSLSFGIPRKGETLNGLTIFSRLLVRKESEGEIFDDMIAFGAGVDRFLPETFQGIPDYWRRGRISEELDMVLDEVITRSYLTGSGIRTYRKSLEENGGKFALLCGHRLPPGLEDGDPLPEMLCTPTTKAPHGEHDINVDIGEFRYEHPGLERIGLNSALIQAKHAASVGLIRVDGKEEYGIPKKRLPRRGYVLADESGTFDACRYWDKAEYHQPRPKLPRSWSKEYLRIWGVEHGIDKLDPKNPEHVAFVNSLTPPKEVIHETTNICLELFERITGKPIEVFWREDMGIAA